MRENNPFLKELRYILFLFSTISKLHEQIFLESFSLKKGGNISFEVNVQFISNVSLSKMISRFPLLKNRKISISLSVLETLLKRLRLWKAGYILLYLKQFNECGSCGGKLLRKFLAFVLMRASSYPPWKLAEAYCYFSPLSKRDGGVPILLNIGNSSLMKGKRTVIILPGRILQKGWKRNLSNGIKSFLMTSAN